MAKQLATRVVAILAIVVCCLLAGQTLWTHHTEFYDAVDEMGVRPVLLSFALAFVATLANWPAWHNLLLSLNAHLPVRESARLFFVSQLGKYLPGSIWPIAAQAEVGRRYGVPRVTMVGANVIATLMSCAVGLIIAAATLPFLAPRMWVGYFWILLLIPVLGIAIHPRMAPRVLNRVLVGLGRSPVGYPPRLLSFLRPASWSCVVWLSLGGHVASLALSLVGGGADTVLLCVAATAVAVTAGVLVVPLPAGIGVRDVVLTALLLTIMNSPQALLVVIVSRLMLVAADLLLALIALVAFKRATEVSAGQSHLT
jgi:uncharacterized membrane protein YbhN (UPF0104 family)